LVTTSPLPFTASPPPAKYAVLERMLLPLTVYAVLLSIKTPPPKPNPSALLPEVAALPTIALSATCRFAP
jgi:hypothetical protein